MVRAGVLALLVTIAAATACGDGDDGQPGGACVDLDAEACRTTAGCALDVCFACACAPSYVGCRGAGDAPRDCPEVACPTPLCCDEQADCAATGFACAGPNDAPGCGACNNTPGTCTDDGECPSGEICEPITCSCSGERTCVAGCTADTQCGAAEVCAPSTHRCVPRACASTAGCPPDFSCTGGACLRTACTDDTACDGFCVNGRCEAALGECRPPVP